MEVIEDLGFLVEVDKCSELVHRLERYSGNTPLIQSSKNQAVFALSAGIRLRIDAAAKSGWGTALIKDACVKIGFPPMHTARGSSERFATE